MRFHAARTKPNIRARCRPSLVCRTVGVEYDMDHRGLYEEPTWRHLPQSMKADRGHSDIALGGSQEFPPLRKNSVAVRPARYWCCAEDNAAQIHEGSTYYI